MTVSDTFTKVAEIRNKKSVKLEIFQNIFIQTFEWIQYGPYVLTIISH